MVLDYNSHVIVNEKYRRYEDENLSENCNSFASNYNDVLHISGVTEFLEDDLSDHAERNEKRVSEYYAKKPSISEQTTECKLENERRDAKIDETDNDNSKKHDF